LTCSTKSYSRTKKIGFLRPPHSRKPSDFNRHSLSGVLIHHARLLSIELQGACLKDSTISFTAFNFANLANTDFKGAVIYHTGFNHARLRNASFQGACLTMVDFRKSLLNGVDFRNTKLIDVNFKGAALRAVKVNWNSNVMIAELLSRGEATDAQRKIVASIAHSGDCRDWASISDLFKDEREWAYRSLSNWALSNLADCEAGTVPQDILDYLQSIGWTIPQGYQEARLERDPQLDTLERLRFIEDRLAAVENRVLGRS
jgi:uncharacterized protein YjbI with pentapeptide repeats